jgi:hypothetical protein
VVLLHLLDFLVMLGFLVRNQLFVGVGQFLHGFIMVLLKLLHLVFLGSLQLGDLCVVSVLLILDKLGVLALNSNYIILVLILKTCKLLVVRLFEIGHVDFVCLPEVCEECFVFSDRLF